jgi:hypothetical protein
VLFPTAQKYELLVAVAVEEFLNANQHCTSIRPQTEKPGKEEDKKKRREKKKALQSKLSFPGHNSGISQDFKLTLMTTNPPQSLVSGPRLHSYFSTLTQPSKSAEK